ncbi:type II toxin-antitoxin system RelE/ParE family toxin [Longimicrobium sp.]|uniref:type II toxin-antitoxin system RelE/ParE family toxin n=1 Tax=Longimicrobium sp. TaxID=2029185 RepID=UPI002E33B69A|nr:type II toxin-antitoxin system RelE/ParE family toxin [Longimicrobium sp.]HEX6038222.1 type II toxin-antitoxin system RelE/ParE family toxin [Longimicrobium sp.]
MSEYTLSPTARRDLVAAALYATRKAGTTHAGNRVIDRLAVTMELLAQVPSLGRVRDELRPRLRSYPSKPFIIFYRRTRTGIHVHRILHQRQDVRSAFPNRRPR